jgi:hypothetical protein
VAAVGGERSEPSGIDALGLDAGVGEGGVGSLQHHVLVACFEEVAELGATHSDDGDFIFHFGPL